MNLSVIVPVFNEEKTVQTILKLIIDTNLATEIVVVDDGSTDGTKAILEKTQTEFKFKLISLAKNQGKGSAVRTGIQASTGDIILIQDADLEYDPREYPNLLKPLQADLADVVYGSRFLGSEHRPGLFWNQVANNILTLTTNLFYNTTLSDIETGYKIFRRSIIQDIPLHSTRFEIEPEITAKLLKRKVRLVEVPITFYPRDYTQGKKIKFADALHAFWAILKYRFVD